MSTNDVPGAKTSNNDELGMGCWAEHEDGSLLLVESTENGRVIYSVFDMSKKPPVEFRDAMGDRDFKNHFTWDPKGKGLPKIKWTWHDKTPFPWDKIIAVGGRDGPRHVHVEDQITAAEEVAKARNRIKEGIPVVEDDIKPRIPKKALKGIAKEIVKVLQKGLDKLNP